MDISQFHTVDWVHDSNAQNEVRLVRSRSKFSLETFLTACRSWLALAASGAIIGAIAVVLTLSSSWSADLREGHCEYSWYLNESSCCLGQTEDCSAWIPHHWSIAYLAYVIVSVIFAVIASFLVTRLAPLASGSGISEIKCIVQGFDAPQFLEKQVLLVKCVALPLTIASGFSVGKEGPSVHYAACVGHIIITHSIKQDYRKRSDSSIACCAAGVAVAFGSPIGGLLFGIEEMAATLNIATIWRTYFCCLVATSVVSIFRPFRTGQLVLFSVEYNGTWRLFELPFFIMLGIFGGLMGKFIAKYNLRVTAMRKRYWGLHPSSEAVLISSITACVCYFNSYLRVDMTKSMQISFHECEHGGEFHNSCDSSHRGSILMSSLIACVSRTILLSFSYGAAKVPAGIFVPSLAIGALFGRLIGTFVWISHDKFPDSSYFSSCPKEGMCINPGAYSLLGAGASLSGVMHITSTVVIVMFELTGVVNYIVPTMIVVGVTKFIASQSAEHGIADQAIKQNHFPFVEPNIPEEWAEMKVSDIMVPVENCTYMRKDNNIPSGPQTFRTYPILDEGMRLVGSTNGARIDESPLVVAPEESISMVNAIFYSLGPHTLYVTSRDGVLRGLITRKAFVSAIETSKVDFMPIEEKFGKSMDRCLEYIEVTATRFIPAKVMDFSK